MKHNFCQYQQKETKMRENTYNFVQNKGKVELYKL